MCGLSNFLLLLPVLCEASSWLTPGGTCAGPGEVSIDVSGNWVQNNFAGEGPDSGAAEIRLSPAGSLSNGRSFDMVVTKTSGYTYKGAARKNDDFRPNFANINQQAKWGNEVGLTITFYDTAEGYEVTLPEFYFSFFDLDHGGSHATYGGPAYESVIVPRSQYSAFYLWPDSELQAIDYQGKGTNLQIKATRFGLRCDNPVHPMDLQANIDCWGSSSYKSSDPQNGVVDQRKRAVMFKFGGRSSFNVVLKTYAGDGQSNYLFAGKSALVSTCISAPPTTPVPMTTTSPLATTTSLTTTATTTLGKATCVTNAQLQPENEAGTCVGRCASGYRCCISTNRCVADQTSCHEPPLTCTRSCREGWACCPAQGNQCIKAPIGNYKDLCVCTETTTRTSTAPITTMKTSTTLTTRTAAVTTVTATTTTQTTTSTQIATTASSTPLATSTSSTTLMGDEMSTTVATTSSSSFGCSDADLIVALVDVPSAEVCAQGCSDYTEPPWLGSTTLSPAGCQHSVWKPSGECRFYKTRCSGEMSTTATTTSSSSHGCSDADLIVALVDVPSAEVCAQGCSEYIEPPWLGSTTLSPAGCQHSVWKPSGECRFYKTKCSEEPEVDKTTLVTTTTVSSTTVATQVMTTSSAVEGCLAWCAGNSYSWSSKCTWRSCKRCGECASIQEPARCKSWCAGNSHTWTSKCVWKSCRECSECATMQDTEGCKHWCAGNSKEWSAKCTWKNCNKCTACKSSQEPRECKKWCARNSNDWDTKCAWKSCRRCDACGNGRRLQDRSAPFAFDVSRPVVLV